MQDRFTEACRELPTQSAYLCHNCETTYGHPTVMHLDTMPQRPATDDSWARDAACIFNCDPMPFGD